MKQTGTDLKINYFKLFIVKVGKLIKTVWHSAISLFTSGIVPEPCV